MVQCESQPFKGKYNQPVSVSNRAQPPVKKFRLKNVQKIFTELPADSELVINASALWSCHWEM